MDTVVTGLMIHAWLQKNVDSPPIYNAKVCCI